MNFLAGVLPLSLANLTQLVDLNISQNTVMRNLEPSLFPDRTIAAKMGLIRIAYLILEDTNLSGPVPVTIGGSSELVQNSMRRSRFSGQLPASIGNLTKLTSLSLVGNQFSGPLPSSIGRVPASFKNCTTLFGVRLEFNQFNGSIDQDFGVYPDLNYIDLSYNQFQGTLSHNWTSCKNLTALRIAGNNIYSTIPNEITHMINLAEIDFSSNSLSGIPPDIGSLRNMAILKLQSNKLSGSIPALLPSVKWQSLSTVDFSHNDLEGPLPDGYAFRTASLQDFADNKGLCGGIQGLPPCKLSSSTRNKRHMVIVIGVTLSGALVALLYRALQMIIRAKRGYEKSLVAAEEQLLWLWKPAGKIRYSDIVMATDNFDDKHCVGKVYRAKLPSGQALLYLHQSCKPPIIHQDISSKNILLRSELEARVSDFGRAVFLNPGPVYRGIVAGTYGYVAPELAYGTKATEKVDVYSFGVLVLENLMGRDPKELLPILKTEVNLSSMDQGPNLKAKLDPRLAFPEAQRITDALECVGEAAHRCIQENPQNRPTMYDVSQLLESSCNL
ncbi:MDIS1-interacting receptor like kinase 1-like protein [Drosera capensis]